MPSPGQIALLGSPTFFPLKKTSKIQAYTTGGASLVLDSINYVAGELLLVPASVARKDTGSTAPNLGCSDTATLTWTEITAAGNNANYGQTTSLFYAIPAGSGSTVITITTESNADEEVVGAIVYGVLEHNGIGSAQGTLQGDDITETITLSASPAATSLVFGVMGANEFGNLTFAPSTGANEELDELHLDSASKTDHTTLNGPGAGLSMQTQVRTDGGTGTSFAWTMTTNNQEYRQASIAVEILVGVASFPQTINAQVCSLTLTPVAGSMSLGKAAQVCSLTLTPVQGTWSVGALTRTRQLCTFTLTPVQGTVIAPNPVILASAVPASAAPTSAQIVLTEANQAVLDLLFGSSARIYRRVDIYEADSSTPWMLDAPLIDGEVTVDSDRDERRACELTLDNFDGSLASDPNGFWYDKVLKVYRGVETSAFRYEAILGTFMIDRIAAPRFPNTVKVTCRDFTKKLLIDKLPEAVTFPYYFMFQNVIAGLLVEAGITNYSIRLPNEDDPPFWLTGGGSQVNISPYSLGNDLTFEKGTNRWQIIKEIATAFSMECFFTPDGQFVLQQMTDPTTAPLSFTFQTGSLGNIVDYNKATHDTNLFNSITVTGANAEKTPIAITEENVEPTSPTRIERLGRRSYLYDSVLVTDPTQARSLAVSLLNVMALESYEIGIEALVVPWLEAATTMEFVDPDPTTGAPSRFLLTSFSVPLSLGSMSVNGKRVTIVG